MWCYVHRKMGDRLFNHNEMRLFELLLQEEIMEEAQHEVQKEVVEKVRIVEETMGWCRAKVR